MSKYKTFEELKEELGDKFEDYMYKANIELLNKLDKIKEYLNKVELGELENGKPFTFKDFLKEEIKVENEEAKWLLELLEEIE